MTTGPISLGSRDAAARPERESEPRARWAILPDRTLIATAAVTAVLLTAWEAYLLIGHHKLQLVFGLAAVGLIALSIAFEEKGATLAQPVAGWWGRALSAPWTLACGLGLLAGGLGYRLLMWPQLLWGGDSAEYDRAGTASANLHGYFLIAWRTPGYSFTLSWLYGIFGVHRYEAVHALEIALSLLTAVMMAVIAQLLTGRRSAALIALALGCLLYPLAAPAGFLMSEQQAVFLATLSALLVLALHYRRRVGAAALALGPTLGLMYETRPQLAPWALVALGVALVLVRLGWRRRLVVVLGVVLTLLPAGIVNYESSAHVLTAGAVLDVVPQALGTDRFNIYTDVPPSPAALEAYRDAILTDGAGANVWLGKPPAAWAGIMAARRSVMVAYVLDHARDFTSLYLRRAPLLYRYDQPWDLTDDKAAGLRGLLLLDAVLLAAAGGLLWLTLRRRWVPLVLLSGVVVAFTLPLPLIHVEPRYSLPALPVLAVLAAIGVAIGGRFVVEAVRRARPGGIAVSSGVVAAALLVTTVAEAWAWPGLQDMGMTTPPAGAYQLASCSVGRHMLTAVAWRPGTSRVEAGGTNGVASWDVNGRRCPWTDLWNDVWDVDFALDGRRFAVAAYNAGILDSRTLRPLSTPRDADFITGAGADVLAVSFDPSDRWLAFTAPAYHLAGVYDTDERVVSRLVSLPDSPISVRWSPDGSSLAVSSTGGALRLYDPQLRLVQVLRLARPAGALAWSPSGDRLAAGDDGGGIQVWRVAGAGGGRPLLTPLAEIAAHRAAVRGLAFSPDGTRLASASSDHLAIIWSAADLRPVRRLVAHTATVWSVAWSPDGQRVVTAAADGTLKLWAAG